MSSNVAPINPNVTIVGALPGDLTPRETDMIVGIVHGLSNQDIADSLFLSINSVKTYIRSAYRKIGATTRSHAVIWAVTHGFLDEPLSA